MFTFTYYYRDINTKDLLVTKYQYVCQDCAQNIPRGHDLIHMSNTTYRYSRSIIANVNQNDNTLLQSPSGSRLNVGSFCGGKKSTSTKANKNVRFLHNNNTHKRCMVILWNVMTATTAVTNTNTKTSNKTK